MADRFLVAGTGPSFRPQAREITDVDIVTSGGGGGGTTIGDQINNITNDVTNITNDLTTVTGDVTQLQADLATLDSQVLQNTTDINSIQNQIANGDFVGTVSEPFDTAARIALPDSNDIQIAFQQDNSTVYVLAAGASAGVDANWLPISGGGGGTGGSSDDVTNLSTVGGVTVTDALNTLLNDLNTATANFIPVADIGQPNGVAPLDATGLVPLSNLPPYPLTQIVEVADAAARLALSGNPTDAPIVAAQLDDGSSWALPVGANPTIPGDWIALGSGGTAGPVDALSVTFDDTGAGLGAANVQAAIEALDSQVDTNTGAITTLQSDVTALVTGGPYIPTADAGVANGVAQLDATGLVPLSQLPDLTGAKTLVPDQAARLALPIEPNDIQIAIQQDNGITYAIAAGGDTSVDANWTPIATAPGSGGVDSFNGRIGVVAPQAGDYDAPLINFTSTSGLVGTQVAAALDELNIGKSDVGHGHQAFEIVLDTFAFDGALSATDVNVQLAMETLDDYLRTLDSDDVANASGVAGATVTEALDSLRASLIAFSGDYLQIANNLSEITDPAAARANLGLGTAATQDLADFLERVEQDLNPTLGADLQTNGFSIQQPNLVGPTETESAADIAGTFDFDYRAGTFRVFTVTANVTLNSIQEPDANEATTMRMLFKNPGGFTIDFTSNNGLVTFQAPGGELYSLPANAPFVIPDNSVLILDYSGNEQSWLITEGGEDFQTV